MKKITKGHYTTTFKNIQFDIIKDYQLEGDCIWQIEFRDYNLGLDILTQTEYDQLYSTKKEALDIAKEMINEYKKQ